MKSENRAALRELRLLLGRDDYRMAVAYFRMLERTVGEIPVQAVYGYKIPEVGSTVSPRNPKGEDTGDFTGRCWKCGSTNLWSDNLTYGCSDCGMLRVGS